MASEKSVFGSLLKGYLDDVGKTETDLAAAINLHLNKLSAAIHGKYRLKRDHFDRTVDTLAQWGVNLASDSYAEFLESWRRDQARQRPTNATGRTATPLPLDLFPTPTVLFIGEHPATPADTTDGTVISPPSNPFSTPTVIYIGEHPPTPADTIDGIAIPSALNQFPNASVIYMGMPSAWASQMAAMRELWDQGDS